MPNENASRTFRTSLQSLRKRANCGVVNVTVGTKRSDQQLEIAAFQLPSIATFSVMGWLERPHLPGNSDNRVKICELDAGRKVAHSDQDCRKRAPTDVGFPPRSRS